ncbi:Uncharacterized protein HZ326_18731 [Fusarium oxysporum f. sp. albedinis]|nr:Uncharacterized protein HZ326_18731 [Fusarium oxysporum f. sp. albedinis]
MLSPSIYKRSRNDTPIRKYFYTQRVEVMAQLQKLEFTTSGSLVPDHDVVPVVDKTLSIPLDELRVNRNETRPSSTFNSATSFAFYEFIS